MKWFIPLSHDTYQSVELQVPEGEDLYETMHKGLPVALKLQEAFEEARRFERGDAIHPKSFPHDLDGMRDR